MILLLPTVSKLNINSPQPLPKLDRPAKEVIRKLPYDTLPEEINHDLLQLNFPVLSVAQMSNRDKGLTSIFPCLIAKAFNLQEINGLEYILHYRIKAETYKTKEYSRCFNCQRLAPSQQTCFYDLPCLKCAGLHLARECKKRTRIDSVKCANCGAEYPANY